MDVPLVKAVSALVLDVVGMLRRFGGVPKGVRSKWSKTCSEEVTWSIQHLIQKLRET